MDDYNSATAYRMALSNNLQQSARDSLQQNRDIPPTLDEFQGKEIKIFVARDLSFYHVAGRKSS